MSDEEVERQRTERRQVIDNNKAMAAANTTRRAWIRQFLARPKAPKEVLRFAVEEIAASPDAMQGWLSGGRPIEAVDAVRELGLSQPSRWRRTDVSLTSGEHVPDTRLPLQLLAHVAAAVDGSVTRDAWRWQDTDRERLVRWLTFLTGQGYTLAAVEQLIVDGADQ
jgi:ParB family chromosome partitioning protein